MPAGRRIAGGLIAALAAGLAAGPAAACEVPDEGTAPLRLLVAKVKYLPETELWAELMARARTSVGFVLLLDEPRRIAGQCHWIVEVRAEDRLWKRFLVPGGEGPVRELPAEPAPKP